MEIPRQQRPRQPHQGGGHSHRHRHNQHRTNGVGSVHHGRRVWRTESEVSCCVKYMVFGFNVIFWLVGLAVFIVGLWAQFEKNPFSQIGTRLTRFYLDPALILLILGFVTFVIGFSGCVGALRENTFLLALYASLVGVLLLTELAIGIMGFVFKDWVKGQLETELDQMIVSYRDDPDLQSLIDWIQSEWLQCCGIHGPNDWDMNIYFNKSSAAFGSPEAGGVPFSCCASERDKPLKNLFCGYDVRKADYTGGQHIYQIGCLTSINEWAQRNLVVVGSVAVGIAVVQHMLCESQVWCEGCLFRGRSWLDSNFVKFGVAALVVVAVEILGICFAQNLRSDIFAQRARWRFNQ